MRIHIQNHPNDGNPRATLEQWHEAVARAGDKGRGLEISIGHTEDEFSAAAGAMNALITSSRVVQNFLPAVTAPSLKLVFLTHAGVDSLAKGSFIPPGVTLLNNSGAHGAKAAEFALMAVLMLANHLPLFGDQQRQELWQRKLASSVAGRRVTIIGIGSIGGAIAQLLKGLGMHVTGVRTSTEPHPHCDRVVATSDLDKALPETEFLVLVAPLTPQTFEMLNRHRIGLLPAGAGVVNIGRGELVEQDALLDALDSGALGGAVLDVTTPEPVPPGHRLWKTRNLILTPHMSSGDPLTYIPRSLDIFLDNIDAHRAGRPLPNEVDLARGY
ncbi:D-2-hydroxyacid dehydrogenase [Bosea caraganae]|uniref:D-2-hydroxyacid dehydrogenase n=1 Tax=Bosea caraganae TaxID=2763117 RepID=A0A370L7Z4_9HYPH|nr:D-2-hydroxyacid dehydrogenase [Bosea caraganae]RDJ25174.1 D-2-hydroxyacid dehydrogenase [Bosea caraganae]RDJ26284.1 D-2-hydroxyacid dehydrogenase [Bosea caraganae]